MPTAAELLEAADEAPVGGWSFSWIANRSTVTPLPWDFRTIAESALVRASVALDMGTGGGEFLATVSTGTAFVVATEAWLPNAPVAKLKLDPLGIPVVHDEGAADNVDQAVRAAAGDKGRLPFRSEAFDVVLNRHEAFVAREVARVLRPGGEFVTQQADSGSADFYALLGLDAPPDDAFRLDHAAAQLKRAGLTVVDSGAEDEERTFADIGALAWYLRRVPWTIPGFTIERHREALLRLHDQDIRVRAERFWLRATK
jgi:SAM-dependent methyltransferase